MFECFSQKFSSLTYISGNINHLKKKEITVTSEVKLVELGMVTVIVFYVSTIISSSLP